LQKAAAAPNLQDYQAIRAAAVKGWEPANVVTLDSNTIDWQYMNHGGVSSAAPIIGTQIYTSANLGLNQ
jgi:hypothetical protein